MKQTKRTQSHNSVDMKEGEEMRLRQGLRLPNSDALVLQVAVGPLRGVSDSRAQSRAKGLIGWPL